MVEYTCSRDHIVALGAGSFDNVADDTDHKKSKTDEVPWVESCLGDKTAPNQMY